MLDSSIDDADTLDCCVFSIIEDYHPSAYLLLPSRKKVQKMHNFKRFSVFTLASAFLMQRQAKKQEFAENDAFLSFFVSFAVKYLTLYSPLTC